MNAYGIFNDEGMIDGPFYTRKSAQKAYDRYLARDEVCRIRELCPDHEDQPNDACEDCAVAED